jgi:hypothetical protein
MSSDIDASPLHPVVSREWRLSPLSMNVLFHCHCHCDEMPRRDAPAVIDAIKQFMAFGIIERSDRFDHGYQTTPAGKALVEMLCKTPLPVSVSGYKDPRTGQWVG